MSKYVINNSTLTSIGDAIRSKTGETNPIPVNQLASTIAAIEVGGETGLHYEVIAPADKKYLELTEQMLNAKYLMIGRSGTQTLLADMSSLDENNIFQTWVSILYNGSYGTFSIQQDEGWTLSIDENNYLRLKSSSATSYANIFYNSGSSKGWIMLFS